MKRGFTLLDLLIVIVILAVLGMVAIPQLSSMEGDSRLKEAAGEVVAGLQYAGSLAVRYQRPFAVQADIAGNWFRVYDVRYELDAGPHHAEDPPADAYGVVLNPFDKKWFLKDFDDLPGFEGVRIKAVPGGGAQGQVRFYPDGHASDAFIASGGGQQNAFVLASGSRYRAIGVEGNTGKITVAEY